MFQKITSESIQNALMGNTRQYITGRLKLKQALDHIDDENIEIGVTDYKEYTAEHPHTHKVAFEYQYMISGKTKYLDTDTDEETYYEAGDFYKIEPGTKYAQKSVGGTTILFIKTPPGNDKVTIETNDTVKQWLERWE